jgi:hypothetical protein
MPSTLDRALAERLGLASEAPPAPPWSVSQWFNHRGTPLQPEALRGRVVVLHTFQMLCRGCVRHGLPQAQRLHRVFDAADVAVLGLHTVFEHHEAMRPVSLEAFLHENRIAFPVGVDEAGPAGDPIPQTMRRYGLQGTPSLVLIDRAGRVRRVGFGAEDDLAVGAAVAALVCEASEG